MRFDLHIPDAWNPRCWNCEIPAKQLELLKVAEAAETAGVSVGEVHNWMSRGCIEWLRNHSGTMLIIADSLPEHDSYRGTRARNVGAHRHKLRERAELLAREAPDLSAQCYVCGREANRDRVIIDSKEAMRLSRVKKRTLDRWVKDGAVEAIEVDCMPSRLYYLDSLFTEPVLFRDLFRPRRR